jgi:ABC-type lipoprotein export system ATPase subunit
MAEALIDVPADRRSDAPSQLLVRGVGITRVYGAGDAAVHALRDATFTIPAGARIALVGPSGSGKSTLLHLIAGIDHPSTGRIEWPGLRQPLRPGQVGIAFQGLSLLPQLDVTENITLPLALAGMASDEAQRAAAALIDNFGLSEVANKLPEQISGGQAQRAALARAVIGAPRLILADEPTGQQDQVTAQTLLTTLFAIADQLDAALVVATHDDAVAARFPTRWSLVNQRLRIEEDSR